MVGDQRIAHLIAVTPDSSATNLFIDETFVLLLKDHTTTNPGFRAADRQRVGPPDFGSW